MIYFENVTKSYTQNQPVVSKLNLEIKDGEFFVFIGPSGSGKTTTLKMINRLIPLTTGYIRIDDKPISDYNLHELRWNIGYVLQQIALFPNMTVEENITVVPEMKKWSKQQMHQRVTELLESVGLTPEDYRNRKPSALSGGEQQRIGVVRALAADPDYILMDEPFSALDPISKKSLQQDIAKLHKQLGKTIVFVTHDMQEALALGDRICIMDHGQAVQIGTPEEIQRHPKNDFVRTFLESGNVQSQERPTIQNLLAAGYSLPNEGSGESSSLLVLAPTDSMDSLIEALAKVNTVLIAEGNGKEIGVVNRENLLTYLSHDIKTGGKQHV